MNADEMFRKLGYEKLDNQPPDDYKGEYCTKKGEQVISYVSRDKIRGYEYAIIIGFHANSCGGVVEIGAYKSDDNKIKIQPINPIINMDEVKAINAKCKELGWINGSRIEEMEQDNRELKEKYIELKRLQVKFAKHQAKLGNDEVEQYMLAQIGSVPTFTTWDNYIDWVDKSELSKILDKYAHKSIEDRANLYDDIERLIKKDYF